MINETLEVPQTNTRRRVSSDGIRTVTSSTFSTLVLEGEGPIVVEFMSYGCAHCRAIEPVLQQVAETVKSKDKIFRVNITVQQELSDSDEIGGTPTLIMIGVSGSVLSPCSWPSVSTSQPITSVEN